MLKGWGEEVELNALVLLIGRSWSRSSYFLSISFLLIQMLHPSLSDGCFEDGCPGWLGLEPLHDSL